jgi:hypothetical protein
VEAPTDGVNAGRLDTTQVLLTVRRAKVKVRRCRNAGNGALPLASNVIAREGDARRARHPVRDEMKLFNAKFQNAGVPPNLI